VTGHFRRNTQAGEGLSLVAQTADLGDGGVDLGEEFAIGLDT
jgi:hypothetical protein